MGMNPPPKDTKLSDSVPHLFFFFLFSFCFKNQLPKTYVKSNRVC